MARMAQMIGRVSLVYLVLVLAAAPALAQISADGSIRGCVRHGQGGALRGVSVTATGTSVAGVYTAVTDEIGFYRLLNIPPGEYTIGAELSGFAKFVRPRVLMRAGLNLSIDVAMKVGQLAETVEVK